MRESIKHIRAMGFDALGQYYDLPDDWYGYCCFCERYIAEGERGYIVYYGQPEQAGEQLISLLSLECEKCRTKRVVKDTI